MANPAALASARGGIRKDSRSLVVGRNTLPAAASAGRPSAPITSSCGRQVRFNRSSVTLAAIVVVGESGTATRLTRFDQQNTAGVRHALVLQCRNRGGRGEGGVAVIGGAAAVQAAVANDRGPWVETFDPAGERRLLVEMAVKQ